MGLLARIFGVEDDEGFYDDNFSYENTNANTFDDDNICPDCDNYIVWDRSTNEEWCGCDD